MCLEFTQRLPTSFVGLTGWPNASMAMTLDTFTTTPNVTIGLIQKYFLWSPVLIQMTKSIWKEWNWWKPLVKGQILAKFVQEEAATTKFDLNLCFDWFWIIKLYRVSHSETSENKWLWGVEKSRLFWIMVPSGFMSSGHLSFINQFSKNCHWLASTASNRKGARFQYDISWFYQNNIFSKHQIKAEFKNLDDSEVLSSDFPQTLEPLKPQWPLQPQQPPWPQWPLLPQFIKKKILILTVGSSLAPKWPIQVPFCGLDYQKSNFSLILALFLWKAVEASVCYFFENWLVKPKCHLVSLVSLWDTQYEESDAICFFRTMQTFKC